MRRSPSKQEASSDHDAGLTPKKAEEKRRRIEKTRLRGQCSPEMAQLAHTHWAQPLPSTNAERVCLGRSAMSNPKGMT
jgi:hypothetical protein